MWVIIFLLACLLLGQAALVHEAAQGGGLLPHVQILALEVLHQGQQGGGLTVCLNGQTGNGLQAGQTGRPQAALPGHQLPVPVPAADRQGLEHPQLPDGVGQPRRAFTQPELEELAEKREMGAGDLEVAHKITDTIKNIDKICMLEDGEGYSEAVDGMDYGRGSSYANRGKHYVRGHYSRDGGMDASYPRRDELAYRQGISSPGFSQSGTVMPMDRQRAEKWVSGMQNADGTQGPHWSMEQTEQVRTQQGIQCDPVKFWVTMNMMPFSTPEARARSPKP